MHILSRIATRKSTILSLSSSKMAVLRRWDDLDSSNEEEVTIDETSYIEIWQKISFCVTNKVEINALQGYSTFVTDEMSQNTLYILRV